MFSISHKGLAHLRRNAVGYLALSIALGGTSYAAVELPRDSVGRDQLRAGRSGGPSSVERRSAATWPAGCPTRGSRRSPPYGSTTTPRSSSGPRRRC
jgi:hypothetical protein